MSNPLPPKVRIVLLGTTLSAIGNGLVLPYLFIYLHNVRGISAALAGLIVGYGALASLITSPLVGHQIDHWGPKPVMMVSTLILAVGYGSLSLVHSVTAALACMTVTALGNSGTWPAMSAILAELTPDHLREKTFATNFALLNLGLGIGGLIASAFVKLGNPHPAHLAWAYAVNMFLIATCQLWIVKKIQKIERAKAMAIAGFFWIAAWLALSLAGVLPKAGLFFVILCQFVFSFGEMFWSPTIPSIVNQLAPDHLRGRYNAASSNAWQIAAILGPSFAGTMIGAGLHWAWIGLLVIGLTIVSISALRLKLPAKPVSPMQE